MKYLNAEKLKNIIAGVRPEYIPEIIDKISGEDVIPTDWLVNLMVNGEPDDSKAAWRVRRIWQNEQKKCVGKTQEYKQ